MTTVDITNGVEILAHLLVNHPELDDGDLVGCLERTGLDAALCERLVAFVPLAFGRVFLQADPPRFADAYLIPEPSDSRPHFRGLLADEPVFVAAHALAQQWLEGGLSSGVEIAASHSAEVHAVSDLLRAGSSASSLILTEPLLIRLPYPSSKPWWKVW